MKLLKIISFLPFLTQIGQKSGAITSFNHGISSYICLKFPLRCLYNHYFSFRRYFPCKIYKNLLIMAVSLLFSQHWTLFGSNFAPRPHQLWHFLLVSHEICYIQDSIKINNFDWNPVVLKKIAKTSKIYHFWPNLHKTGVPMGHSKKKFF